MSYISEQNTFHLKNYLDYLFEKLPKEEQTDQLYQQMENHVVRTIVRTISHFMLPDDAEQLIEKIENNDEKANQILVEYIENYPELERQLSEELDHFESLTLDFLTKKKENV